MVEIYPPAEDSYLMSEVLKEKIPKLILKNSNLKFLEIGSGSGINLQTAYGSGIKKKNIFSCDVNPDSIKYCKSLGFNCVESDLFNNLKENKFDIIIFNPPYLPEEKSYSEPKDSKLATTGGLNGSELSIKFLKKAKRYLSPEGRIFIITSSLSDKIDFIRIGCKFKPIKTKKLFFEKLFLWEITF